MTTRNDRCTEHGGTCTNGYLKDTELRRKENDCGGCFAGFKLAGGKCTVDPATAGWARPGECEDCATTTLQAPGAVTFLHQSAGPCAFVKTGKPRLCQPALNDTASKAFKCSAQYTMCDPPLTTTTTPKPVTTSPKKTCTLLHKDGVCRDTRAHTCAGGFETGLCPEPTTNACCKSGKYAPITVPTPNPRPPPTPKSPGTTNPRPSPTPPRPTPATTPPPAPGTGGAVCGVNDTRNASSFRTRQGMEDAGWKFSSTRPEMFYTDEYQMDSEHCREPRTSYCGFVSSFPVGWIELKLSLRGHTNGTATVVFGNGARYVQQFHIGMNDARCFVHRFQLTGPRVVGEHTHTCLGWFLCFCP